MRYARCASIFALLAIANPDSDASAQVTARGRPRLLLPGEFLGDREWPATGESWFGLYAPLFAGYQLRRTSIKVETVPNVCAGTATKISTSEPFDPLFLIEGVPDLREGPVDTAFAGRKFLYPGEGLSWRLGPSQWYRFQAVGSAVERAERGEVLITDYRLTLRSTAAGPSMPQDIVVLRGLTLDNTPLLRWLGDLDRDGRLDVFLQVPGAGYSKEFQLLLSSIAKPPEIVGSLNSDRLFL
ncbi:MAG: hypothetical protein ACRDHF_03125 [Tepidiformaceae bacterium]